MRAAPGARGGPGREAARELEELEKPGARRGRTLGRFTAGVAHIFGHVDIFRECASLKEQAARYPLKVNHVRSEFFLDLFRKLPV